MLVYKVNFMEDKKIVITATNLPVKNGDKLMGEGYFEVMITSPDSLQMQSKARGQISAEPLRYKRA